MKTNKLNLLVWASIFVVQLSVLFMMACQPIQEFQTFETYQQESRYIQSPPDHEAGKKTVILIADNQGTEIFDLLAPFYLFNATGKANVYILAPEREAIVLRKGLFILPHETFASFDQKGLKPDLIVIPNLSTMQADSLNPEIISWIRSNYDDDNRILSVCDGSLTAAATGLYDEQPITTHASDLKIVSGQFSNPRWTQDISVTKSGRLYSTAGVSHAVEGSLVVIRDMFGEACMKNVMQQIHYPYLSPKSEHKSIPIALKHKLRIVSKTLLKENKHLGVLLHEGISEFELAALLDTYHRTFPASIKTFTPDNHPVPSANGLLIVPTGKYGEDKTDEMHMLSINSDQGVRAKGVGTDQVVIHHDVQQFYIFDYLLGKVEERYGAKFRQVVAVLLDYNEI